MVLAHDTLSAMDLLLVAAAALLAMVPLWLDARRHAIPPAIAALGLGAGIGVVAAALCWPEGSGSMPAGRPIEVRDGDYVGSGTCRACHPGQHATWHESFHRTMTQVLSRDALAASFDALDLDWFGRPVRLRWNGDELWVDFERGGRQPGRVVRPVVQLTGSHHLQVLWYSTGKGRELAPVPLVYRIDEGLWLPLSAVFLLPPQYRDPPEPGTWNVNCHMCHATAVLPRVDVDRCDTHVAEFGIACEACHGPGRDHVAANRQPLRRYRLHLGGGRDDTIVDPQRLSADRSAQVCGQCHAVSIERIERFDIWREHGLGYRPGDDLTATRRVLDPAQPDTPEARRQLRQDPAFFQHAFWPDGEIRLSGREYNGLLRTPCHTHGDEPNRMTCLSCHQMHRPAAMTREEWTDDQLRPGMRGNRACTQCHGGLADERALVAHTHHRADSPGSNCYNCHMGFTSFGLMKAMRSHTVTSPSVQRELATGRPNACNQCHLDRTLAWTAGHLAAWYGQQQPPLDADQSAIAASIRWLLQGDAGLRALAAWSMGWDAAQQASAADWQEPYLAQLLADPYYVVRFLARRALRTLPGHRSDELADYDLLAGESATRLHASTVQQRWQAAFRGPARGPLLLDERGLRWPEFQRLLARRDDRPVYLAE